MSQAIQLAVTPGEPAGIGPDLCIQTYQQFGDKIQPIYFVDPVLIEQRAQQLGIQIKLNDWSSNNSFITGEMNIYPLQLSTTCKAGELNPKNADYVLQTLEAALDHCKQGSTDALVTAPVNKSVINEAGIDFSGHTEWLAAKTNTKKVVMMLASKNLRVALATTHLPLRKVADAINEEELGQVIEITLNELRSKFAIDNPTLMVCGLNPHAGENGYLGREEIEVIEPVIRTFQQRGLDVQGPIPADTVFTEQYLHSADAVLAMYHDQGLPVLKYQGFGEAINITLGLPIIRTSVDHGTALDLAGGGKADPGSLLSAMHIAAELAGNKKH